MTNSEATVVKKSLAFTAAVVGFAVVKVTAERWLELPEGLSIALGFFVMMLVSKPLSAGDVPMSRWIMACVAGALVGWVIYAALGWVL